MRPHIIKRLGLWWCGERDGNLIRHSVCHTSPKKAYESWVKHINHVTKVEEKGLN